VNLVFILIVTLGKITPGVFFCSFDSVDVNQRGCLAEYLFATECMRRGYYISMPLSDSSIYDAIVDTGERLIKVQIKSSIKAPKKETEKTIHIPLQNNKSKYTIDKVDYFAVYSDFYAGWFIFKNNGVMQSIRISLTGKNKIFFNNFAFE
jgi:hypothetical protein